MSGPLARCHILSLAGGLAVPPVVFAGAFVARPVVERMSTGLGQPAAVVSLVDGRQAGWADIVAERGI